MLSALNLNLSPERLDIGTPEERATFGLLTISTSQFYLTEGFDSYLNGYRKGPLVSGYHAAEWLAWNWWRLRWEPRSDIPGWAFAHCMPSIGEGYVWPNITIFSDGVRTALISNPSSRPDAAPFRYVGSPAAIVPSTIFEGAVDSFLAQVLGRLDRLDETNLERLWRDVLEERNDSNASRRRRLEALLGCEPEESDAALVEQLVVDATTFGDSAVDELAVENAQRYAAGKQAITGPTIWAIASGIDFNGSPSDAVLLASHNGLPRGPGIAAWRLGAAAARALRIQEGVDFTRKLSDERLTAWAGVSKHILSSRNTVSADISFALDKDATGTRVVLRSTRKEGRRFDLARLIGDRILSEGGSLHPATRSFTYRQKAQRSFAAELLSPFEAIDTMLAGDYSEERQQEVAKHFGVSVMTVNSSLKNNGRISRGDPREDFDVAAA